MAVYGVGDWYGEYAAMSPTYTSYLSDAWRTMDSLGTANYTGTGKEVAFWYYLQRTDMQNYGLARTQLFDLTHYYMAANPTNCYFFIKQNFSKHHNSNDFYAQAYPTYTLTGTYGYTIADTLWSDTTISYLAAMEADIGSPSGFRTQPTSGVWVRQYTKGIVVLNMNSSGSAYLSLGGTYSPVNADGTYGASVSSTTIPYKTGQIFISTTIHPTIWIGGGSAVEGDSISLTITTDSIPTVPVIYQLGITAGTATEGASCAVGVDYITRSITDTIAIGNMSKTVKVATCQDISGEASETFTMTLSNVSPSTINISTPTATGTITDNDTTLRVFSATAVEGQSVSFLVTMNRSISVPVTFRVMTFQDIGSAISGVDFTAVDSTFSIPAGYTSIYIPVQTIDDALSESTEHFSLFLYPPSVGHIEAGYETATGYIVDNDAAGPSGTAKHFPHWKKKI